MAFYHAYKESVIYEHMFLLLMHKNMEQLCLFWSLKLTGKNILMFLFNKKTAYVLFSYERKSVCFSKPRLCTTIEYVHKTDF